MNRKGSTHLPPCNTRWVPPCLRNNELAEHDLNGNTTRRVLATAAELRKALEDVFLLDLPDAPELDATLARLSALRP